MIRAKRKPNISVASSPTQNTRELLTTVVTFLRTTGMSQSQLLEEWRAAIRCASDSQSKLAVAHVKSMRDYPDIVNRWLRDPNYLNHVGRPDELPLKGQRSIASLVKTCKSKVTPDVALAFLIEHGNVKQVAAGKYRLIRRYMNFEHSNHLAFEPQLRFFYDAAKVSIEPLDRENKQSRLFWHCADNSRIDPKHSLNFLRFARQRSLTFMHEINDWLDEHEYRNPTNRRIRKPLKRLGIGLFGICSDSDR